MFASVPDVHGVLELHHGLAATDQSSVRTYLRHPIVPSAVFPRVMALPRDRVDSWGFWKNLVVRPVKNGDARLKHTATEKTAAVPVAEAESTKVLTRSALRHREDHSRAPPGLILEETNKRRACV